MYCNSAEDGDENFRFGELRDIYYLLQHIKYPVGKQPAKNARRSPFCVRHLAATGFFDTT